MDYFEDIGALPKNDRHVILAYIAGFVASLVCTLVAYWLVKEHIATGHAWLPHYVLTPALIGFALLQCAVQLVCFLHVSLRRDARLKSVMLGFAFTVVIILVGGSLWIMHNLNARMIDDTQGQIKYVQTEDAF